jgi:hypothetical protein
MERYDRAGVVCQFLFRRQAGAHAANDDVHRMEVAEGR